MKKSPMIEVQETDSGLYVTDAAKNELHIEMPDWEEGGQEKSINREVDETIVGATSKMVFPKSAVCVESKGRKRWRTYANKNNNLHIENGEHQIQISSNVIVYIKISGDFIISRNNDNSKIQLDFGSIRVITIGIRSQNRRPSEIIDTPSEPENLAIAISYLSSSIETTKPDRSYPSLRNYPPRLRVGDDLNIPNKIHEKLQRSGIKIQVPKDNEYIFIVAPLTYYLQAELSVDEIEYPRLEVPNENIQVEFSNMPKFQEEVVDLLRRVFWLDCLVRNEGRFKVDLDELKLADEVGLNTRRIYDDPPQTRLAKYLNLDFQSIDSEFPEWHFSTYVEPVESHISIIPHLLEKLSIIYKPQSREVEMDELLEYSLNHFQRSSIDQYSTQSIKCAEPTIASRRHGRVLGWFAEGYPINTFKGCIGSFENKLEFLDKVQSQKNIIIILNDKKMEEEKSVVARKYRKRSQILNINLEVLKNIDKQNLLKIFGQDYDFVHYIGHCTEKGLLCADGFQCFSMLDNCNSKTFFLNACGSFDQGRYLIDNGSIGGIVTRNQVLNREATRIGSTFSNLILHGFDLEQSLKMASKKSIASHEYFVIGDGTFRLTQGDDPDPSLIMINSLRDKYQVIDKKDSIRDIGICQQSDFSIDDEYTLVGNPTKIEMAHNELLETLALVNGPVIYNGTYYWSDDLHIKLQN